MNFGEARIMNAIYLHYYSLLVIQIMLSTNLSIIGFKDGKQKKKTTDTVTPS